MAVSGTMIIPEIAKNTESEIVMNIEIETGIETANVRSIGSEKSTETMMTGINHRPPCGDAFLNGA